MITQSNDIIASLQNELFHPETNSYSKLNGSTGGGDGGINEGDEMLIHELDTIRTQEIAVKAVSGIFMLLLQWFKLSRTLSLQRRRPNRH